MQKNFKSTLLKHTTILSKRDYRLKILVNTVGNLDISLPKWGNIDDAVVYSVIGQMLSSSASKAIIARLKERFDDSLSIIDWCVQTSPMKGPLLGVSQRKRRALSEWNTYRNSGNYNKWSKMPLEVYQKEVIQIWGFGKWSSDMIAIFHLSRMDIWPETDKGIERACRIVFGNDMNIRQYVKGCETVASLFLWDLINNKLISEFQNNLISG